MYNCAHEQHDNQARHVSGTKCCESQKPLQAADPIHQLSELPLFDLYMNNLPCNCISSMFRCCYSVPSSPEAPLISANSRNSLAGAIIGMPWSMVIGGGGVAPVGAVTDVVLSSCCIQILVL
jgi:hypothetical protein